MFQTSKEGTVAAENLSLVYYYMYVGPTPN